MGIGKVKVERPQFGLNLKEPSNAMGHKDVSPKDH